MKIKTYARSLGVALLLVLKLSVQAQPRAWTDVSGRAVQAEFVSADASDVTLSIGGKNHTMPITRLSVADQDWIRQNAPTPQQVVAAFFTAGRDDVSIEIEDKSGKWSKVPDLSSIPADPFVIRAVGYGFRVKAVRPFPWQMLKHTPALKSLSINFDAVTSVTPSDLAFLHMQGERSVLYLHGSRPVFGAAAVAAMPVSSPLRVLGFDVELIDAKEHGRFLAKFPMIDTLYLEEKVTPASGMPAMLKELGGLKMLHTLRITGGGALNAGEIQALDNLNSLKSLQLSGVPRAEWTALASMKQITSLGLSEMAAFDDAAMQEIARMQNLYSLHLYELDINDSVLAHLGKMSSLRNLHMSRLKNTTQAGVTALKAALPKCKITDIKPPP